MGGVECDDLDELYEKVHEAIREDPAHEKKESSEDKPTRDGNEVKSNGKTWTRMVRLTFQERKERVAARIAKAQEKMMAGEDQANAVSHTVSRYFFGLPGTLSFD